ncbi:MAG TPA: hypothetical protein VGN16_04945 [Acidobacteriaceae bacterium]|jgi:hypothetical protein
MAPSSKHRSTKPQSPQKPASTHPEVIDPRWVVKALGIVVAIAALCGYLTLCGLFYYGQWQFAFTPSHAVSHTPADVQLGFDPIRFGADASGQPQLDGWWIPADVSMDPTVLLLHAGTGTISDALPEARMLHDARLNVLLFDYRGAGKSAGQHPTETSAEADTDAALSYLTGSMHIPAKNILVFGEGIGASLAARLCEEHHELPGIILQNADGDLLQRVKQDSRAPMVPVGLLFHENFPLAARLHTLATPKLLITTSASKAPPLNFQEAADPKMTVEIQSSSDTAALHASLRRFLDTYVARPVPVLTTTH